MKPDHPVTDSAFVVRHLGRRLAEGGEFEATLRELREVCAEGLSPLLDRIEQGWKQGGLSAALAAAPELYSAELVALIRRVEMAGADPTTLLDAFSGQLERMVAGLRVVRETLTSFGSYFAVLMLLGLLIYNVLVLYVAPAFEMLFGTLGNQLPPLTRLYLGLGDWLWLFDLLLLVVLVQLYLANQRLRRSLALGAELKGVVWQLPPLKAIANLYRANLSLHAMRLLDLSGVKPEQVLAEGETLATLAPASYAELHAAARLGRLDAELEWQCEQRDASFARDVRNRTRRLSIALYLLIALFFGGMVIAFYAPLFSIASAI